MNLRGLRGDGAERVHHRVEAIDDLAIHHARRADLHNAARGDVVIRRLEVERDVALERRADILGA